MKVQFFVPGRPLPQPRPRARAMRVGTGHIAQVYNPGTTDAWKKMIWLYCKQNRVAGQNWSEVVVELVFSFSRPQYHFLRGVLRENAPHRYSIKPDCDNLAKCALDAIKDSGCFFADDGHIFELHLKKQYAQDPGMLVIISSAQP